MIPVLDIVPILDVVPMLAVPSTAMLSGLDMVPELSCPVSCALVLARVTFVSWGCFLAPYSGHGSASLKTIRTDTRFNDLILLFFFFLLHGPITQLH